MGFLSKLNPFRHKKDEENSDYSSLGLSKPGSGLGERPNIEEPTDTRFSMPSPAAKPSLVTSESVAQDNIRAKMELMATQIDSMRMQQESMNQRIVDIETMVKQLLIMAKE